MGEVPPQTTLDRGEALVPAACRSRSVSMGWPVPSRPSCACSGTQCAWAERVGHARKRPRIAGRPGDQCEPIGHQRFTAALVGDATARRRR
jgi:hypothetical protein